MDPINNYPLVAVIISIVGTVISVIGAGVSIYKVKPETKKLNAEGKKLHAEGESALSEAAESVASGAKIITDLATTELAKRVSEMEDREKDREYELGKLRLELENVKSVLADWQDWAWRLAHQLRSLDIEPVPFKVDKKQQ